ncbi:uncharacterized protein C8orf34 homolog isoform X2 [Ruditapes philippinarum]|uniref:uncharacterized protein C8orf34 homolog isoform X2 n=1 Tax=Ruditapes philippinarum TaxID=129788 RepID=UPI00295BFD5B|nr:uncharacterized protein C8orf34 homolog isoform X2 [Ruditapes philippinarum]
MTKLRVQQYMEKHRLTPLFEDLMNRVLHEQPDDPIVYLIKCLYKKASIPVPKDLKTSPVRRSSPERLPRRSKSPEKGATQAWAVASGPDLVDRSYEKPWLKHSKKTRSKDEDRCESRQGSCIQDVNLTSALHISKKVLWPRTAKKQQKSGWMSDTKVTTTSFDELFEEDAHAGSRQPTQGGTRHRKEGGTDITKAWAQHVSLDDSEDPNYRSKGYSGPRCQRDESDPLAGEIMLAKEESTVESSVSLLKPKGAKQDAERHRQDLEKILHESDKVSIDSGFDDVRNNDEQDDAIELLEDPEDLLREGVTNIPTSGYKLSRILRQRQEDANVKLNINVSGLEEGRGSRYDDYYESDLERPPTGMSFQSNRYSELSPDVSDDEFESVSQVVGPRQPVWSVPDSDGETYRVEPSRKARQTKFSATAPVRFDEKPPFPRKSVDTENMFLDGSKTWTPGQERTEPEKPRSGSPVIAQDTVRDSMRSLRSQDGGGWNIPDDTEVSLVTDWSESKTTGRASPGPPKAY